jgi:hypothetical protein
MHNAVVIFNYLHSHRMIIICICVVMKCSYYPLFTYEVIDVLDLKLVILTFDKYKKVLSIVEHYYSYHTC